MSIRLLKFLTPVLQPVYRRYVSRARPYRYKAIHIRVNPGVFYPGLIFSTKILLRYIDTLDLKGKAFLELGAGSGILSLLAASKGAVVTASDINPLSVMNIIENARRNNLEIHVIESDLFEKIPLAFFDYIIIAPPYYPRDPANYAEMAWYCGKSFEYFENLFQQLPGYVYASCTTLMILSEDCNIQAIRAIGTRKGFEFSLVYQQKKMGEWNYVFRLKTKLNF